MRARYCILHQLGLCPKHGGRGGEPRPPLYLVDEPGNRLELRFRCDVCEMEVWVPED
jgi:putative protease